MILTFSILSFLLILFFIWLYKELSKTYNTSNKSLVLRLLFSYALIFASFLFFIAGTMQILKLNNVGTIPTILLALGAMLLTIGFALVVYYTQALESKNVIDIIEKRIDKKLKEISKDDLKSIISNAAVKVFTSNIDIETLKKEIKEEVTNHIKEKKE